VDEYWVEGDFAQASTDSRQFGPVTREELKAKVLLIYWPLDRRRAVR
jgi:signal peptidase I